MGEGIRHLAKIRVDYIYFSHYQAHHFIVEGYQVCQDDFPLVNPCLVFLVTFLLCSCLEMVSRISCSIIFPRMEVRPDGLVVPWVLLPAPFEARSIYFSSVLRHLSQWP